MDQVHSYIKFNHFIWYRYWYGNSYVVRLFSKRYKIRSAIYQYVVAVDWIFTGISGIIQPITGFWMVYIAGYSLSALWVTGSIVCYLIAAVCWLVVVYLQIKIRDITLEAALENKKIVPPEYYYYFKYWFILGWPAFLSLLTVFYLMTLKPSF